MILTPLPSRSIRYHFWNPDYWWCFIKPSGRRVALVVSDRFGPSSVSAQSLGTELIAGSYVIHSSGFPARRIMLS